MFYISKAQFHFMSLHQKIYTLSHEKVPLSPVDMGVLMESKRFSISHQIINMVLI